MKKVITPFVIIALTLGFISCEAESLSDTSTLYEHGTDGDVVIIDKRTDDDDENGTDGDVVIIDKRTDDEDGGN